MATVPFPGLLTVEDWMLLEDPPGGRYEILDGTLVVTPSPGSAHNRLAEDLADLLRVTLRRAGLDDTVTVDVEWRVVVGDKVREAPRPDVAVGWVDPKNDRLGGGPPRLVVEVWSDETERYVVRAKRRYWASKGARWLWEVTVSTDPSETVLEVWDLHTDAMQPVTDVRGTVVFRATEPFAVSFRPSEVTGWSEHQALRADTETARADTEAARADTEAARADTEAARANDEARRADALAARLRALGIEPDPH